MQLDGAALTKWRSYIPSHVNGGPHMYRDSITAFRKIFFVADHCNSLLDEWRNVDLPGRYRWFSEKSQVDVLNILCDSMMSIQRLLDSRNNHNVYGII